MTIEINQCPTCYKTKNVKRGKRKVAFGEVQLYQCKNCGRTFSKSRLAKRTYPSQIIRWTLQLYCKGYNIDEIQPLINRRFKIKVGRSTIHRWINEHNDLVPINKWKSIIKQCKHLLMKQSFFHENLEYLFQMHVLKTEKLVKEQFHPLFKYLWDFKSGCPDAFFQMGLRCSQPVFVVNAVVQNYKNLACDMAKFAIKSRRSNRQRHSLVEEFMLICDVSTVAVEVPVWYWEKSVDRGITGHIDVLQVRKNNVYIMDYKPGAIHEKKAVWQLYQYATALGFRANIPFRKIRCAYFDDKDYFEFKSEKVKASLIR